MYNPLVKEARTRLRSRFNRLNYPQAHYVLAPGPTLQSLSGS